MLKNAVQIIVIILGVLIFVAFLALIYGMYLKISITGTNLSDSALIFSSQLASDETIKNLEVLDHTNFLILIARNDRIKGAIYDIDDNQIIRFIDR